jgi:hypothetical protein
MTSDFCEIYEYVHIYCVDHLTCHRTVSGTQILEIILVTLSNGTVTVISVHVF